HQAVFAADGRTLYVCDLGSDRIWIHDLDDMVAAPRYAQTPPGYGPRHLACHANQPYVYVFCELSARLLTFAQNASEPGLSLLHELDTLPSGFNGEPAGAAISLHPSAPTL